MSNFNTIGMLIKRLRQDRNLTQDKLGEAVGVTKASISAYENGKAQPSTDVLHKLAVLFDLSIDQMRAGLTGGSKENSARMLGAYEDMDFVELPFITYSVFGTFAQNCLDPNPEEFSTIRIIRMPSHEYRDAAVVEVRGNSMAPKYPERARFVIRPVSDGNWQHSQGVHAIALRSHMFIIKRIISNRDGVLELLSDSTGEQMTITLGDINCMWKVGEAVYFPAED